MLSATSWGVTNEKILDRARRADRQKVVAMTTLQELALLAAFNCVRNTCIEEFHCRGQLSQKDMERFNKEVVNKLYSFFLAIDQEVKLPALALRSPFGWDEPEVDKAFRHLFKKTTLKKPGHFDVCIDENCERRWCVDRRNATCLKTGSCEIQTEKYKDRCRWCHTRYFCSGYGECDLHGDHGP